MTPPVRVLDPLIDARWDDLVSRHPRASVFHTRGWLEALQRTYGYEPFALTTTRDGPLDNGLPCCRVETWAARRLVSLPFSDHCEPLVDRNDDLALMLGFLETEVTRGRWRSLELRPRLRTGGRPFPVLSERSEQARVEGRVAAGARYVLHTLDLMRPAAELWGSFHHSSTQRAIRKAEREGIRCETGRSKELLADFYRLLRLTRRRHGLPPQPRSWFENLASGFGDSLAVSLATRDGEAIAGILTLSFKKTLVYKYGGSDAARHHLGAMPFLFWQTIQHAAARGIEVFDLGRSDLDQPGLIAFKDHLGAGREDLTYYGWPQRPQAARAGRVTGRLRRTLARRLPDTVLDATGRLLYRHLG